MIVRSRSREKRSSRMEARLNSNPFRGRNPKAAVSPSRGSKKEPQLAQPTPMMPMIVAGRLLPRLLRSSVLREK